MMKNLKFISWNVNGLRACCGKGFADSFRQLDADFFCLQETKMQAGQLDLAFEGYQSFWNYADKNGNLHTPPTAERHLRNGNRRTRPRRTHHHTGNARLLPRHRLYAQFTGRTATTRLSYAVGRRLPSVPPSARRAETCHRVWRHECGTSGNRPEEPQEQPHECRFHRSGTGKVLLSAGERLHRHLPPLLSRHDGHIFVVVLPLPGS